MLLLDLLDRSTDDGIGFFPAYIVRKRRLTAAIDVNGGEKLKWGQCQEDQPYPLVLIQIIIDTQLCNQFFQIVFIDNFETSYL